MPDVTPRSLHQAARTAVADSAAAAAYRAVSRGFHTSLAADAAECDSGSVGVDEEERCMRLRCAFDASPQCASYREGSGDGSYNDVVGSGGGGGSVGGGGGNLP